MSLCEENVLKVECATTLVSAMHKILSMPSTFPAPRIFSAEFEDCPMDFYFRFGPKFIENSARQAFQICRIAIPEVIRGRGVLTDFLTTLEKIQNIEAIFFECVLNEDLQKSLMKKKKFSPDPLDNSCFYLITRN